MAIAIRKPSNEKERIFLEELENAIRRYLKGGYLRKATPDQVRTVIFTYAEKTGSITHKDMKKNPHEIAEALVKDTEKYEILFLPEGSQEAHDVKYIVEGMNKRLGCDNAQILMPASNIKPILSFIEKLKF